MKTSLVSLLVLSTALANCIHADPGNDVAPTAALPAQTPVTFLGIEAEPVDATLSAQLGLAENTGLKILSVFLGSPARDHLKAHDILTKFRDQILIDPHQLGVLVRSCKPGEEVVVNYLRAGKESAATIKLAQRDAIMELTKKNYDYDVQRLRLNAVAEEVRMRREKRAEEASLISSDQRPKEPLIKTTMGSYQIFNLNDQEGTLSLRVENELRQLTAKDTDGKTLFEGSVATDTERTSLPKSLLTRLEKIESSSSYKHYLDLMVRLKKIRSDASIRSSITPPSSPPSSNGPGSIKASPNTEENAATNFKSTTLKE